jgi:hypothetical protein
MECGRDFDFSPTTYANGVIAAHTFIWRAYEKWRAVTSANMPAVTTPNLKIGGDILQANRLMPLLRGEGPTPPLLTAWIESLLTQFDHYLVTILPHNK